MAFDLSSVTLGGDATPPRIIVYGPHGVGKTTLAASAPKPIVIRTEDGLSTLRVPTFPVARHYGDVLDAIGALYGQAHPYETAVLDSLDWLEPLIWQAVARENGVENIEGIPYGKGYIFADEKWQQVLDGLTALRDRGMTVIALAHTEIKRFDAPDTEPYDRYQIKLHKRAAALVQEWADVVGFARYEVHTEKTDTGFNKKIVRGVGAGTRLLSVEERPAWYAKNRYALPANLPLSWPALQDAISRAYAAPAVVADVPNAFATDDNAPGLEPLTAAEQAEIAA